MKLFALLFTAIPLLLIAIGINQVRKQDQLLSAVRPIEAVVTFSQLEIRHSRDSKGRRSTAYIPHVAYRYIVDSRAYDSDRVFADSTSASREEAEQIIRDHPIGKEITAYADPAEPQRSVLFRQWEFSAYGFILFPMIHFSVGLVLLLRALFPEPSWRKGFHWQAAGIAWFFVGIVAAIHYFTTAETPASRAPLIAFPIYFAAGLVFVILYLRAGPARNQPAFSPFSAPVQQRAASGRAGRSR